MSLTQEQVKIIRSTVPVLQAHGGAVTTSFYGTLLKEVPELKNIFNHTNQVNEHQAKALAGALYAYASHIDDLGALGPAVETICEKHASLYIRPEQYKVVGDYLLRAMGDVLGAALTPEILDAWGAAYWQLAHIMIKREDQIYQGEHEWKDWRDFRIADKVRESDEIISFYLKPVDRQSLPSFPPGQYISVLVDVPELHFHQPRQYSLSDAPNPDYYRISVKREDGLRSEHPVDEPHLGYVSNLLHSHKQVGDVVQVSHPVGEFFLDLEQDRDVPIVLVSAGVGLTPMMSMLNSLVARNSHQRISFIHGARTTSVQAFRKHIQDLVAQRSNITTSIFLSAPKAGSDVEGVDFKHAGRVSLSELDAKNELWLDDKRTKYFICGPSGFMVDMSAQLQQLGVEQARIKMELFGTGEISNS